MESNQQVIDKFLQEVKQDLISNYNRLGLMASGKWERSLKPYSKILPEKINFGIEGANYTYWLQQGRKPTKEGAPKSNPSLRQIIRKWIDDKNIVPSDGISKDSLAFLIARKIHKKGIRVPGGDNWPGANKYNAGGLVSDVVTTKRIETIVKQLTGNIIYNSASQVINTFKNGNN